MLSGLAARERSVCDAEDETAVSAGFRIEAVRMLRAGVRSPKQLAIELGCSEQTLRNWQRQDEADRGERADLLISEEPQRLRELERENTVLRHGRERALPRRPAGNGQAVGTINL